MVNFWCLYNIQDLKNRNLMEIKLLSHNMKKILTIKNEEESCEFNALRFSSDLKSVVVT